MLELNHEDINKASLITIAKKYSITLTIDRYGSMNIKGKLTSATLRKFFRDPEIKKRIRPADRDSIIKLIPIN